MSLSELLKTIPDPYEIVRRTLNAYFTTFHDHTASGLHNIPKTGPIIFASNHSSFYDPPVIGIKSPRPIHYLARDTLFKGFFGECLQAIGTIPIARGTADVTSIKAIFKALKKGEATAIFPEGTRSLDGSLQDPQAGTGMIAIKSKATVVPTRIFGAFEAFGRNEKFPTLNKPIHIVYGEPLSYEALDPGKEHPERYLEASKKIMHAIDKIQATDIPIV
ncbi:MAG: lysophospholipid acyltransferase family protein [Verrucomicrobia bacterium]|nr:lysophospholipid acyltransferase family protein [Verrucomicrobiota bacterium]